MRKIVIRGVEVSCTGGYKNGFSTSLHLDNGDKVELVVEFVSGTYSHFSDVLLAGLKRPGPDKVPSSLVERVERDENSVLILGD